MQEGKYLTLVGSDEGPLSGEGRKMAVQELKETIGQYRVVHRLGSGGFGNVFEAVDTATGEHVALKLLDEPRPASGLRSEQRDLLFAREFEVLRGISHPKIRSAIRHGDDPVCGPYLVLELLRGVSLKQLKSERFVSDGEALSLVIDLLPGVRCFHENGMVHLDIKMANLIKVAGRGVVLIDPQLATPIGMTTHELGFLVPESDYVSPEVAAGLPVEPSDDFYSLGRVLEKLQDAPSAALESIIAKATAPRGKRYATLDELETDLRAALLRVDTVLLSVEGGREMGGGAGNKFSPQDNEARSDIPSLSEQLRSQAEKAHDRMRWGLAGAVLTLVLVVFVYTLSMALFRIIMAAAVLGLTAAAVYAARRYIAHYGGLALCKLKERFPDEAQSINAGIGQTIREAQDMLAGSVSDIARSLPADMERPFKRMRQAATWLGRLALKALAYAVGALLLAAAAYLAYRLVAWLLPVLWELLFDMGSVVADVAPGTGTVTDAIGQVGAGCRAGRSWLASFPWRIAGAVVAIGGALGAAATLITMYGDRRSQRRDPHVPWYCDYGDRDRRR